MQSLLTETSKGLKIASVGKQDLIVKTSSSVNLQPSLSGSANRFCDRREASTTRGSELVTEGSFFFAIDEKITVEKRKIEEEE
jgi:hypothetical protein